MDEAAAFDQELRRRATASDAERFGSKADVVGTVSTKHLQALAFSFWLLITMMYIF